MPLHRRPVLPAPAHEIEQHYIIDDISDDLQVPGTVDNIWLTKQLRVDRDYAAFGEISFDITDKLTLTGGGRVYKFDNSLVGFFGYSNPGFSTQSGLCLPGPGSRQGFALHQSRQADEGHATSSTS